MPSGDRGQQGQTAVFAHLLVPFTNTNTNRRDEQPFQSQHSVPSKLSFQWSPSSGLLSVSPLPPSDLLPSCSTPKNAISGHGVGLGNLLDAQPLTAHLGNLKDTLAATEEISNASLNTQFEEEDLFRLRNRLRRSGRETRTSPAHIVSTHSCSCYPSLSPSFTTSQIPLTRSIRSDSNAVGT